MTLIAVITVFAVGRVMAAPPDLQMWRLDCSSFKDFDISGMSDTFAYPTARKTLSDGCYLIQHGKQLMLWDTGLSPSVVSQDKSTGLSVSQTLLEQLRKINIKPEQISIIGVSHGHFDHTGQAASFPKARLLMGKADFDAMAGEKPGFGFSPRDLAPWLGADAMWKELWGIRTYLEIGASSCLQLRGTPRAIIHCWYVCRGLVRWC